jgi:hypothetical protein
MLFEKKKKKKKKKNLGINPFWIEPSQLSKYRCESTVLIDAEIDGD